MSGNASLFMILSISGNWASHEPALTSEDLITLALMHESSAGLQPGTLRAAPSLRSGRALKGGAPRRSLLDRPVDVRALTEENFGSLHDRFRKGRVRVDAQLDVGSESGHFDGQHALGDQLSGADAHDPDAQHAVAFRVDDQLGHALGAVERHGPSGGAPREARDLDGAILLLRLLLREPAPGTFGVGKHHGGYRPRLKSPLPARHRFAGRAASGGS